MVQTSNLLERIIKRENMTDAYKRVVSNIESHWIDGMIVDQSNHIYGTTGNGLKANCWREQSTP
jgi:sugar lactone lactonase YvrE